MTEPFLKDDAFLAAIRSSAGDPAALSIWWLGQSGFLLQHAGRHVLLDPYLSDSLTQKYAATNKPHVRMTARVIAPERLDFIDVVTSSHAHTDHLDAQTLLPLVQANPQMPIVFPEPTRPTVLQRTGLPDGSPRLIGLADGQSATVNNVEFHAVPAAHEAVDRDPQGRCLYLGYVVKIGRWHLYHSGDTVLYDKMRETIARWPIDLAILPINGRHPSRGVSGNLDGIEAADLARAIGARWVIPCHYDMFEFNTATPDAFTQRCDQLSQQYRVLKNGEGMTLR